MKLVSICVPCFNEEENIEKAYETLVGVMSTVSSVDYEIIFADNDSLDGSQDILRKLASQDPKVKVIFNSRNYGALRSGMNCLMRAQGDAVISYPCDMQEPAAMIPTFIEKWLAGNPVVWGQKNESEEKGSISYMRRLYYKLMIKLSDVPFYSQVDGFGIVDKKVLDEVERNYVPGRGIKTMVTSLGFPVCLVSYKQNNRVNGKSSYSFLGYCKTALDTLVEVSTKPLFLVGVAGIVCSLVSLILLIAVIIWQLIDGFSSFSVLVILQALCLLVVSVSSGFVGIVAAYISHIFTRMTPQPLVMEKEVINMDSKDHS